MLFCVRKKHLSYSQEHIDTYKVIEFDGPFCTRTVSRRIDFFMLCILRNTPTFNKMQESRYLYTISILSPHLYTPFAFVYKCGDFASLRDHTR